MQRFIFNFLLALAVFYSLANLAQAYTSNVSSGYHGNVRRGYQGNVNSGNMVLSYGSSFTGNNYGNYNNYYYQDGCDAWYNRNNYYCRHRRGRLVTTATSNKKEEKHTGNSWDGDLVDKYYFKPSYQIPELVLRDTASSKTPLNAPVNKIRMAVVDAPLSGLSVYSCASLECSRRYVVPNGHYNGEVRQISGKWALISVRVADATTGWVYLPDGHVSIAQ
ncbi:MAG: hypothetical protein ACOYK8_09345 [Alphaproteobacteria bacterium]